MLVLARVAVATLVVAMLAGTGLAQGVPYVIDTTRSEVLFSYSMPLSNGIGRFSTVSGSASIDDAAQQNTKVDAVIDTRTLRASIR